MKQLIVLVNDGDKLMINGKVIPPQPPPLRVHKITLFGVKIKEQYPVLINRQWEYKLN